MSEVRYEERSHGPSLAGEHLRVDVQADRGVLDIRPANGRGSEIMDAGATVHLQDGRALGSRGIGFHVTGAKRAEDAHGSGLSMTLQRRGPRDEPDVSLTVTLYDHHPFAVLQLHVRNAGSTPVRVASFQPLDAGRPALGGAGREKWKLYKEGWQSWSPSLVLPVSGEDISLDPPVVGPRTRPEPQPGRFVSELLTAVADPASGAALVAGFISTADQFSQLWLDRDASGSAAISAASYADGMELPLGRTLSSERLLVDLSPGAMASLQRCAEATAREMRAPLWPQPVSGWCSWYYYWQGISEEIILANLNCLAQQRDELPVDYVQIDDGYQAGIGDWLTPNEKFPRGMGWLAEEVHRRGFKAGLWLAPFMVGARSRLWQEHPEWVVQYSPGKPYVAMLNWQQECYGLDLTRPDVLQWLRNVFRTIFDEWGYDYVKIDFVYAGALDGIRHDPNVTRAQAYRRGLEVIRKVAGERFILGCGNPIGPSIGIINGSRISPDVGPFWYPVEATREAGRNDLSLPSTRNAVWNSLARSWMHGSLWLNDPDCLLARDTETALTPAEVRTLASVIALSGGMVLDSDNLLRLSEERRDILSMMLPVHGKPAVPLDLFESETTRLFELDCGGHRVLGVFNWEEEPAQVEAPLGRGEQHVFEAWSRRYMGRHGGAISLELPAHGCALLAIRSAEERPQVVGSSFHLLQGALETAGEEWDGRTLRLALRPVAKREGELFLWAPPELRPDAGSGLRRTSDGLWATRLRVERETELAIKFA